MVSPGLYLFRSVLQGQEPVFLQAFLPEAALARLHESVVPGLAGTAEVQIHPVQVSPLVQALRGELGAVVTRMVRGSRCCSLGRCKTSPASCPRMLAPTLMSRLSREMLSTIAKSRTRRPSDGSSISPDVLSRRFNAILRACRISGVRFHNLRHTHASMLIASGVPIHVVSARLAHASIQTTVDTYGHVLPASDVEAGRVMERRLAE